MVGMDMDGIRIAAAALLSSLFWVIPTAQAAQTPSLIGSFKNWAAYTYSSPSGKICYAIAQPKGQAPKGVNRDPAYFMVTSRPSENIRQEVSVIIGYPFKAQSLVTVSIDDTSYKLFTKGDGAWINNRGEESSLVSDLKEGYRMLVQGISRRGTNTTDSYSLIGISAALNAVENSCS